MGGSIGAIIARLLTRKYDNRLSGRARELYKKGILVGRQQYIIAKPLSAVILLLALYVLLFQQQTSVWLAQTMLVVASVFLIFLEKPKLALIFHILILIYPFWQKIDIYGLAGVIPIITLFLILFDISLMENLRSTLRYGGVSKVEREKIKEYLEVEKKT